MKKVYKDRKLIVLIILILVILPIIPATGQPIIDQNDNNTYEEISEWKTAYYCWIRGEHVGGISPEWRYRFAFRIKVYPDYVDYLEVKIDNEYIPVEDLRGYLFFGIIDGYSIPRIPVKIFGFLIYCQYKK